MRKLLFFFALVFLAGACQNNNKLNRAENGAEKSEMELTSFSSLDDLFLHVNENLDKTIKLTGVVTHTCKHSGKRCFLANIDGNETIRIEANGKITGFNQELVGSTITVTGILKERRLTKEYIDQWEEKLNEKTAEEDGSAETCAAENNNIKKMRQWMKKHGKNYYSIFFMEGIDYDVVR